MAIVPKLQFLIFKIAKWMAKFALWLAIAGSLAINLLLTLTFFKAIYAANNIGLVICSGIMVILGFVLVKFLINLLKVLKNSNFKKLARQMKSKNVKFEYANEESFNNSPQNHIVFRKSSLKVLVVSITFVPIVILSLLLLVPLLILSIAGLVREDKWLSLIPIIACLVALPCVGSIAVTCYQAYKNRRKPVLIIDNDGITLWIPNKNVIIWGNITAARIAYVKGKPSLRIKVKNPERYIGRLTMLVSSEIWVPTLGLIDKHRDVLKAIVDHPCYQIE